MHSTKNESRPKTRKGKQTFLSVVEPAGLMAFLLAQLPDKSRNTIKSLLAHHQVSVDYKIITQFNHPLKAGQEVIITWTKVQQGNPNKGVRVVFEDPYILVIEKQPGLLSIATDKEKQRTVYRILSDQAKESDPRNRIFVVQRLDRDASGLMIFAKSKDVQQLLQDSSQKGLVKRKYIVVVEGSVDQDQGVVTSWLKENTARIVYSSNIPNDGQKSVTRYRVLKRKKNYTLMDIEPETERKNQVRVHLKDLEHPIAGDKKYGSTKNPMNRMALHARFLELRHPVNGNKLQFETAIPNQFLYLFPDKNRKY